MITINTKMLKLMNLSFSSRAKIPSALSRKISGGFVEINGTYLLKSANIKWNRALTERFHDETGLEMAVNDISIDRYVSDSLIEVSYLIAYKILKIWERSGFDQKARIIIMSHRDWSKIRFHVKRDGQVWLTPDLEDYTGALCVIDV